MLLSSPVFAHNSKIPSIYTCEGLDINPPLDISGVPANTVSLTLIMDDPDIPQIAKDAYRIEEWDHWVVYNMPTDITRISEGKAPKGVIGKSTGETTGYEGPCPPDREHRYFFRLYALDTLLDLRSGATKKEVLKAMEGHIIEISELIGLYEKAHK